MADHNTGNFNALLFEKLRKIWGLSYKTWETEWDKLFSAKTSSQYAEDDLLMSGFGLFSAVGESAAVPFDTMTQGGMKRYTHVEYKKGYTISRPLIADNKYRIMVQMAQALKKSWLLTKEHVCADYINNGFGTTNVGYDGLALFSASHTNPDGSTYSNLLTAADLTTTTLENAFIDVGGITTPEGLEAAARITKLHIPRQLEFVADQILNSPGLPTSPNLSVNTMKGKVTPYVNHYFTDPDAWFVSTSATDDCLILFDREPIEYAADSDFMTDDQRHKAYARFSVGHTDPRGIFGAAGG